LRNAGIKTGIITSEDTRMVERRAKKLKVDYLIQGKREGGKLAAARKICNELGISLEETAYTGDDINCKELLENVGYPFCPQDAVSTIKSIPTIRIIGVNGGDGVIRAIVDGKFWNDGKINH